MAEVVTIDEQVWGDLRREMREATRAFAGVAGDAGLARLIQTTAEAVGLGDPDARALLHAKRRWLGAVESGATYEVEAREAERRIEELSASWAGRRFGGPGWDAAADRAWELSPGAVAFAAAQTRFRSADGPCVVAAHYAAMREAAGVAGDAERAALAVLRQAAALKAAWSAARLEREESEGF